jgi:hypothetical protein
MRSPVLALVLFTTFSGFLAGCDSAEESPFFDTPRTYAYDLVEAQTGTPVRSLEECAAVQPNPDAWGNCWRTATFCPDGSARLMVTDIINVGIYKVNGQTVELSFQPGSEVPEEGLRFTLASDRRSATFDPTGDVWQLWDEDDARARLEARACTSAD